MDGILAPVVPMESQLPSRLLACATWRSCNLHSSYYFSKLCYLYWLYRSNFDQINQLKVSGLHLPKTEAIATITAGWSHLTVLAALVAKDARVAIEGRCRPEKEANLSTYSGLYDYTDQVCVCESDLFQPYMHIYVV